MSGSTFFRVAPIFVDPEMLIISFDEIIHENIQNDRHFGAYRSHTRSMLLSTNMRDILAVNSREKFSKKGLTSRSTFFRVALIFGHPEILIISFWVVEHQKFLFDRHFAPYRRQTSLNFPIKK